MSEDLPLCACGCGGRVAKPNHRWIAKHQLKRFQNKPKAETAPKLSHEELELIADTFEVNPIPVLTWRGEVQEPFMINFNNQLLKFQPGQVIVDGPLYNFLQANSLPILWLQ
jgi:hypothetical protein